MNLWSWDQRETTWHLTPTWDHLKNLWALSLAGCWLRGEVQNANTKVVTNFSFYSVIDWDVKTCSKIITCAYLVVALSLVYCFFGQPPLIFIFILTDHWKYYSGPYLFGDWKYCSCLHLFWSLFHKLLKPTNPTYTHPGSYFSVV